MNISPLHSCQTQFFALLLTSYFQQNQIVSHKQIVLDKLNILIFYYGLKEKNFYTPEDISIKKFPNLILKDFYTNSETSFDDILIGSNYYLVNIWASWCLPCREEHPYLVQLKKNSPIKIIGINYKDKKDNALKFLDKFENPYFTILKDKNGTASIEIGAYGAVSYTHLTLPTKRIV